MASIRALPLTVFALLGSFLGPGLAPWLPM
jgi:hypothetical protein